MTGRFAIKHSPFKKHWNCFFTVNPTFFYPPKNSHWAYCFLFNICDNLQSDVSLGWVQYNPFNTIQVDTLWRMHSLVSKWQWWLWWGWVTSVKSTQSGGSRLQDEVSESSYKEVSCVIILAAPMDESCRVPRKTTFPISITAFAVKNVNICSSCLCAMKCFIWFCRKSDPGSNYTTVVCIDFCEHNRLSFKIFKCLRHWPY